MFILFAEYMPLAGLEPTHTEGDFCQNQANALNHSAILADGSFPNYNVLHPKKSLYLCGEFLTLFQPGFFTTYSNQGGANMPPLLSWAQNIFGLWAFLAL